MRAYLRLRILVERAVCPWVTVFSRNQSVAMLGHRTLNEQEIRSPIYALRSPLHHNLKLMLKVAKKYHLVVFLCHFCRSSTSIRRE